MPRKTSTIAALITAADTQLATDREQLRKLKQDATLEGAPAALLKKQIEALRITVTNGAEDVRDLAAELEEAKAYEGSAFGRENIARAQNELKKADALMGACLATARGADAALFHAWAALRKHEAAHRALNDALSSAYTAVQAGTGVDPYGDDLQLIHHYSRLSNSGVALVEWFIEALKGYEVENIIEVKGVVLNHDQHETLLQADAVGLARCWHRLKEVAAKCGVEVHGSDDPAVATIRDAALNVIQTAKIR